MLLAIFHFKKQEYTPDILKISLIYEHVQNFKIYGTAEVKLRFIAKVNEYKFFNIVMALRRCDRRFIIL